MRVLVDSGSTGNYIDASRMHGKWEKRLRQKISQEELKMADGTMVKDRG